MPTNARDGLVRNFAQGRTRRAFLLGLGGASAPGLGTLVAGQPATARHKKRPHGKGKASTCRAWVLSGGPSPATPRSVDDDLCVRLNGAAIVNDANHAAGDIPAVPFTALTGDALAVTAADVNPACRGVSPLWRNSKTNGAKRQLSAGQHDGCAPGRTAGVFVSEVFTIKL